MSSNEASTPAISVVRSSSGVVRVVLQRSSKRNALTRAMLMELLEILQSISGDRSNRMLVLAAEGPVFCPGMDLMEMQAAASSENPWECWLNDAQLYHDLVSRLFQLPIPTLAVVQGATMAGGVGLVAACDLVIAADGASFSLPEPQRGIVAAIVAPLLRFRVGNSASSFLLLSGRALAADECREIGLCHEVHESDSLGAAEESLIMSVLNGSPGALAMTKSMHASDERASTLTALHKAIMISAVARQTDDAREGLQAFIERRSPAWKPVFEPDALDDAAERRDQGPDESPPEQAAFGQSMSSDRDEQKNGSSAPSNHEPERGRHGRHNGVYSMPGDDLSADEADETNAIAPCLGDRAEGATPTTGTECSSTDAPLSDRVNRLERSQRRLPQDRPGLTTDG